MKKSHLLVGTAYMLSIATSVFAGGIVNAGPLNELLVRFDRLQTSAATTGTICANITAANGTEATLDATFPTGYTVSTSTANWTVSTTNLAWPSGASAWPGIGTASAVAGQIVTFPSSDIVTNGLYCFNWTNSAAVTTKSSATNNNTGSLTTKSSVPATIDSGSYATATVSSDQIVVTASVAETFSFALSGTTDNLGGLSTSSVVSSPTPRVATISTNAKNGWSAWAKDSSTGLSSASAGYTISSTTPGTNSTLSGGSEGYNTGVTSSQIGGSGTVTVAAAFVGGAAGQGGGLDSSLRTLATSNGTADNSSLTLTNNAAISAITPAASDYTDTITVIAAGLF
jgi:hypothetical protein